MQPSFEELLQIIRTAAESTENDLIPNRHIVCSSCSRINGKFEDKEDLWMSVLNSEREGTG